MGGARLARCGGGGSIPAMWLPRILSWSCTLTPRSGSFPPHVHDHDEICLVVGDGTTILHAGVEHAAPSGTVFLFRHGERHGYRNSRGQEPHLWLVHFQADPELLMLCPRLAAPDPLQRIWRLDADRLSGYRSVFMRLMAESMWPHRLGHVAAASAWLRLLLIGVARWDAPGAADPPAATGDAGTATLWEILHEHAESPDADFTAALAQRVVDYDAVRHRFRRCFGLSPRDMRQRLRMQRAKFLLLDSDLGIGVIAERLGYGRSAEFIRAFTREIGRSPGAFRKHPVSNPA